jgi:hypothetical protein
MDHARIVLNCAGAVTGFVGAILWLWSARIKTPERFAIHVAKPQMEPMGQPLGGTYVGNGYSPELTTLANALMRQSRLSACAAIATAVSVLLTTAAGFMS